MPRNKPVRKNHTVIEMFIYFKVEVVHKECIIYIYFYL